MSCSRVSCVLRRHRDPAERRLHVAARLAPVQPAPVGVAAPHRVHLGQVGVGRASCGRRSAAAGPAPYAPGLEPKIRAVARRRSPCSRGVLVGVGAHVVAVGRLVQLGDRADRVVEQRDDVRERVPEEPGDAHRDVDARPAELRRAAPPRSRSPAATRRPTPGGSRAARAPRRCRRPGCASRRCPRRSGRPTARVLAGVGEVPRDAASRRARRRPPRRCGTGSPSGRRSRSCGRSAAR